MFQSDDASGSDHGLPATVRIDRQTLRMEIYPPRSPASAHQSLVLCSLRKSRCLNSKKYITKLTSQSTKGVEPGHGLATEKSKLQGRLPAALIVPRRPLSVPHPEVPFQAASCRPLRRPG